PVPLCPCPGQALEVGPRRRSHAGITPHSLRDGDSVKAACVSARDNGARRAHEAPVAQDHGRSGWRRAAVASSAWARRTTVSATPARPCPSPRRSRRGRSPCRWWGDEGAFAMFTLRTVRKIRTNALAFSPDGKYLATCGEKGDGRIWDVVARKAVA